MPDDAPEENLLPKALQLARAEDCEEQARRVAKWLQLEPRWRARRCRAEDLLSLIMRKSDVVAAIEKARRDWPLLTMPGRGGLVNDAVRDHSRGIRAALDGLDRTATHRLRRCFLSKFNLAIELRGAGSDHGICRSQPGAANCFGVCSTMPGALDELRRKEIEDAERDAEARLARRAGSGGIGSESGDELVSICPRMVEPRSGSPLGPRRWKRLADQHRRFSRPRTTAAKAVCSVIQVQVLQEFSAAGFRTISVTRAPWMTFARNWRVVSTPRRPATTSGSRC